MRQTILVATAALPRRKGTRCHAKAATPDDHADGRVDGPASNRPAHSWSPAESRNAISHVRGWTQGAQPLVLNPASLYHGRCATLDALVAAAAEEVALLELLQHDGWLVDPWATDEFVALRPGPKSQWRVAAVAARGKRVLLHRVSPEGLAVEWREGPWG